MVQTVGVTGTGGVNSGSLAKLRELKLSGAIGEAGEKGKLTYSGIASQIRLAASRGFDENEICAAVIRVITPGLPLRNYLEEQRNLTLQELLPSLQAHFRKTDATALYNQMSAAVMTGDQTELAFCMELIALRDRLLNLSKIERG